HVLTGDANGDRLVNDRDLLGTWLEAAKAPAAQNLNYDLNGDGRVTVADINVVKGHYLATLPAPILPAADLLGDVNEDGLTNEQDLLLVWQDLLKPVAQRNPHFDLNADGQVNAADLGIVKLNYLAASPQAGGQGGAGADTMPVLPADVDIAAVDAPVAAELPAAAPVLGSPGADRPAGQGMAAQVAAAPAALAVAFGSPVGQMAAGAAPMAALFSVRANEWRWAGLEAFRPGWTDMPGYAVWPTGPFALRFEPIIPPLFSLTARMQNLP